LKRRILIALLIGGVVLATTYALAATLSVGANSLAAGSVGVGSCDPDGVSTSYANSWDPTDKRYEVTTVTVNGISDSCDGKTLKVALTDSGDVLLADGSVTIPTGAGTSATVSSLSTNPAASAVSNVHVVIAD
jgi:hypothetical protein